MVNLFNLILVNMKNFNPYFNFFFMFIIMYLFNSVVVCIYFINSMIIDLFEFKSLIIFKSFSAKYQRFSLNY